MEIYDFNVHLTPCADSSIDLDISRFDPVVSLERIRPRLVAEGISGANVMVMDSSWLRGPQPLIDFIQSDALQCTALVDPRQPDAVDLVDHAARLGVNGIKFHPYFQHLTDETFPQAIQVAERAAAGGLWIAVCCSYGTRYVYDVSGLRLLARLSQTVRTSPIICLHAGGRHVLDALSIALDAPNVFLETSFSIPFWLGSSVETDIVFAVRKTGPTRWLYGSDHPYVDLSVAKRELLSFLARHRFSDAEIAQLLGETARHELLP